MSTSTLYNLKCFFIKKIFQKATCVSKKNKIFLSSYFKLSVSFRIQSHRLFLFHIRQSNPKFANIHLRRLGPELYICERCANLTISCIWSEFLEIPVRDAWWWYNIDSVGGGAVDSLRRSSSTIVENRRYLTALNRVRRDHHGTTTRTVVKCWISLLQFQTRWNNSVVGRIFER